MSKHMIIWHSNVKDDDNIKVYSQDPSYVVSADRTDLVNLKKIDEVHKPGIYILSDKLNNRYVGQASHSVLTRLLEHDKKKPWWDSILLFGRDDGKLDKSQLDYLEKKLIKLYADTGFILDNGDVGNKSFIEAYQRGKAESLWENTLQILEDSANIQLFKRSRTSNKQRKDNSTIDETDELTEPLSESFNSSKKPKDKNDTPPVNSNHSKPKHILIDSLGNQIEYKNLRGLYILWVKRLYENDDYKEKFYSMLSYKSVFLPEEKVYATGVATIKLEDGLYLMINLSANEIHKRIQQIADFLNIEVNVE